MIVKKISFFIFAILLLICSCKGNLNPSDNNESSNSNASSNNNKNETTDCKIKFETNYNGRYTDYNGTNSWTKTVKKGQIIDVPNAKWKGRELKEWICVAYKSGDTFISCNYAFDFSKPIEQDLVLSAEWELIKYSIEYILNDGEFSTTPVNYYYISSNTIDLPTPIRDGYTFEGWYETPSFSGRKKTSISKGSTENKIFYAKWEQKPEITIIFELNGGSWSDYTPQESYSTLSGFNLPDSNKVQRTGYNFKGWYETPDFEDSPLRSIQSKTTGTKQLYAKWEGIIYRITYNLNGGNWENDLYKTSYTIEDAFELPDDKNLKYEGHTFIGWFEESDFSDSVISKIEKGTIGEKRYYAKWNKNIEEISVTLESVSGDREITIELKDRYYLNANINSNYVNSRINSWYWKVDGIRISENANNTSSYQLYFGNLNLDAGYHNALLVITTENGNIYSATAIITIQK